MAGKRAGQVRRWTEAEDDHVRVAWGTLAVWRIALNLDRSEKAVHERAYHLGVAQRPKAKPHA